MAVLYNQTDSSLKVLVQVFQNLAKNHAQINDFGFGEGYNIAATTVTNYPLLWVSILNNKIGNNTITYKMRVFFMDLVKPDISNETEVKSNAIQILNGIFYLLRDYYDLEPLFDVAVTPFQYKSVDACFGAYADFDIEVPNTFGFCDEPFRDCTTPPTFSPLPPFDGGCGGGCVNFLNSPSIDFSGSGSTCVPLSANVNLSAVSGNTLVIFGDGLYASGGTGGSTLPAGDNGWIQYYMNGAFAASSGLTYVDGNLSLAGLFAGQTIEAIDDGDEFQFTNGLVQFQIGSNNFQLNDSQFQIFAPVFIPNSVLIESNTLSLFGGNFIMDGGNMLLGTETDNGNQLQVEGNFWVSGNIFAPNIAQDTTCVVVVNSSGEFFSTSSGTEIPAAGTQGQIQFNGNNFLDTSANLVWDIFTNTLTITGSLAGTYLSAEASEFLYSGTNSELEITPSELSYQTEYNDFSVGGGLFYTYSQSGTTIFNASPNEFYYSGYGTGILNFQDGDFSIQNASSTYLLSINNDGAITLPGLSGTGTSMVISSSAGLLSTQAIPIGPSGTTGYLPYFSSNTTLIDSIAYQSSAGNLLIGTTTDGGQLLQVNGNVILGSSSTARMQMYGYTTSDFYFNNIEGVVTIFQIGGQTMFEVNNTGVVVYDNLQMETGSVLCAAGTTTYASLRIPTGVAPTSPIEGQMWKTSTHLYIYLNGATVQIV